MAGNRAGYGSRAGQLDLDNKNLSVNDWMAGRNAQIAQKPEAHMAGRQAWEASARTGQTVHAAQPSDVTAVGMRTLSRQPMGTDPSHGYNPNEPRDGHGRWTTGGAAASHAHLGSQTGQRISYGSLSTPAPSSQALAELRRQQAALAAVTRKLDIQNSWFAVPALAAPLVVLGLESATALAARTALPAIGQAPLDFAERDPYRRVGDNWATRKGRRAHAAFKEQVKSKDGWQPDPPLERPGKRPLRPDAGTPKRNPDDPVNPGKRHYLELKPNTPSGRKAAARAVKRYKSLTEDKVRPIYYDPKDFK